MKGQMLLAVLSLTSLTLLATSQQADNFSGMAQEQFIENDTGPTVTIEMNSVLMSGEEVGLVVLRDQGYTYHPLGDTDTHIPTSTRSVDFYRSDQVPRIAGSTAGGFGDKRGTGRQA